MILLAFGALVYGIVAGVPHETLFLGISIMIAGMSAGLLKKGN